LWYDGIDVIIPINFRIRSDTMRTIISLSLAPLFILPMLFSALDASEVRKVYPEQTLVGSEALLVKSENMAGGKIPSPSTLRQVGTVVDSTVQDYQCNNTLFSRIAAIGDSALHASAMVSPAATFTQRGMKYIYYRNGGFTNFGYVEGSGTGYSRGGYGSLVSYYVREMGIGNVAIMTSHTNIHRRPFGAHWYSFQDAFQGIGAFSRFEGPWGDGTDPCDQFLWPSIAVTNDFTGDMAMVGMTNYFSCTGGSDDIKVTHKTYTDPAWGDPILLDTLDDPSQWGSTPNIPMIAGADNGLMGVVCADFGTNVYYWQSTDGGRSWGDRRSITGFPLDPHKIPPDTSSTEYRPLQNAAISVSPEGIPHVVWTAYQAQGTLPDSLYIPGSSGVWQYRTKLEHWDPVNGITTVYRHPAGLSDFANGTAFAYNVGHPSIGFGETGDEVYVIYEGFVDSDQDFTNGLYFGDVYVSMSTDGGTTWKNRVNVTNSPGSDDLYPAIARVNPQGVVQELPGFSVGNADGVNDFVFIYQNDDVAGTYLQGDEPSANWDMLLVAPVDFEGASLGDLILRGPIPGRAGEDNTLGVMEAIPGEKIYFLYGFHPGSTTDPFCQADTVDIEDPILIGYGVADEDGIATITTYVPDKAGGETILFQAIEKSSCRVSDLTEHAFP
jgi:hypothetical protein